MNEILAVKSFKQHRGRKRQSILLLLAKIIQYKQDVQDVARAPFF